MDCPCPVCKTEMELVDTHFNIELELELGHPVEIETYVCSKCHFEQQVENYPVSFGDEEDKYCGF